MPASKEQEMASAFNAGSDARIAGTPLHQNPNNDMFKATWWERGWIHVNNYWGKDVKGRWFPRLLVPDDRQPALTAAAD